MRHGTQCKFCKKPITLEIDDSYSEISSPVKLLPLAACNRCADLRVERRAIESKVKFICLMRHNNPKAAESRKEHHRQALEKLLKGYANLIARWHYLEGMSWDDECLNVIMEKPSHWATIMAELWKMFAACNPERA